MSYRRCSTTFRQIMFWPAMRSLALCRFLSHSIAKKTPYPSPTARITALLPAFGRQMVRGRCDWPKRSMRAKSLSTITGQAAGSSYPLAGSANRDMGAKKGLRRFMASPPSRLSRRIMGDLALLKYPDDTDRALHLCLRARDYIQLETGKGPDAGYVFETMTDAPSGVPPENVWCWGHTRPDGMLDGIATCLKGFYDADDWYLGLLLLDPAVRGQGLGADMVRHVIAQAHADNANCLRVAVLDANPRARTFWERQRFSYEKSTVAGDGNLRHVLRLALN
mmetsp:Transcript_27666/g.51414  ORF Transcript_27666/g.51414 Transcript_27666/m.51414 type:complete len:279 (-) Transcript_27666:2478-3314(-)